MNMNVIMNIATTIAGMLTGYSLYNAIKRAIFNFRIKRLEKEQERCERELTRIETLLNEQISILEEMKENIQKMPEEVLDETKRKELEDLIDSVLEENKNI